MKLKSKNNKHLTKMLNFQQEFNEILENSWIELALYGSLPYIYYTWDESIDVNDIDLIWEEKDYSKIINLIKNDKTIKYELTSHNSLRLFRDWAKLSIHSKEKALEIAHFDKHLKNIKINWVKFKSLSLNDLIKFYKVWALAPKPWKSWYLEKFNKLLELKYKDKYSFMLLKPSTLKGLNKSWEPIYVDIKDYIKKAWFHIIKQKWIRLSEEDIEFIYKEEYEKLIPILWKEKVKKAMSINKNLYSNKKSIILLIKGSNALKKASKLKWDSYWPANSDKKSIRYIFRDKKYDGFKLTQWEIVDVPCDNVVHCPSNFKEFREVLIKWLI